MCLFLFLFFFFKQKTAYEMRISDWSSDVCSSDLGFYGILVISRRDRPHESDKSRYAASRRHFPVVFVKDIAEFANRKFCGVGAPLRGCDGAAEAEPFGSAEAEIGRASCRERVWQYVEVAVVAVS